MAKTTRTLRPVLDLARWIHRAYRNHDPKAKHDWHELKPYIRAKYVAVAEQMLLDPPLPLRKRVRELEDL